MIAAPPVRVARIVTNETCSQACDFCDARRGHERRSVAGAAAVRQRISAAVSAGATEIVLTGGEPTLRRDLGVIVRHARTAGASRVVLETNAARIDPGLAALLAEAGLTAARVHLPALGEQLDAITGQPGGATRTMAAMRILAASGIEVEASTPLVRANLHLVAQIPAALAAAKVARLWLRVPLRSPRLETLADRHEAIAAVTEVAAAARTVGVAVQLDPATFIPPCAFPRPGVVAHLYAMGQGGRDRPRHARAPACDGCVVHDRCPGIPLDAPALEDFVPRPIAADRLRRRLTVIGSIPDQIEREIVTREIYRHESGATTPAHIVRVQFHCNQSCRFCFVSTHLPPPPRARVVAAIEEIAALGGILVLSGGEPTLDPHLVEHVRLGKRLGAREIELQTNAVRLATGGLARELVDAGVDTAFVSLHGATPEVGDAITEAPGTFVQTLAGIDALLQAGCRVRCNYVLCEPNRHEFPAFVDLVAQRFGGAAITVSFVGMSTDLVPRTRALVPRYTDVLPALHEGLRRAAAHGVSVGGFDSMCGLPLCLVPDPQRAFTGLAEVPEGYDRGEFVHPAPCDECVLKPRCFGLRRAYAEMYGTRELRPIRALL
jgi:MoaA/NifB/PqqE/SkfB family radical SAM enzyme